MPQFVNVPIIPKFLVKKNIAQWYSTAYSNILLNIFWRIMWSWNPFVYESKQDETIIDTVSL